MAVVKFSKQTIEPNPLEVDYWVDITSDPYGSVWKYYNGIDWVSLNLNDGSDDGLSSFDYYTKEQVNSLLSGKADVDSVESKVDDAEFANVIQNIEFREIGDNQMEMVLLKYDNATVGVTIPMASETNPGMLSGESFRDFVKQSQLQSLYDELYQIMSDLSLAEKERNDAEQLRNTSENERIAAETNRFNAENTRQSEEANRVTNENNRVTAENNRTTAEGNRESTFNTLKGQMQTIIQEGQTAVAATEKATSDAQKVVDNYETKVAEQDDKLSELDSEVNSQTNEIKTFKEAVTNQVNNYKPVEINGDVTNAADEEDLTSDENNLLKLKNRNNLNGMGYIILRQNKTFAEQLTQTNTIYEIRYDFDLNGEEVAIPEDCVLKFDGGKLLNGVIVFNNTNISADKVIIFDNIILSGRANNNNYYPEWFGANHNIKNNQVFFNYAITQLSNLSNNSILFLSGTYHINDTIFLKSRVSLVGETSPTISSAYKDDMSAVIMAEFENNDKWAIDCKFDDNIIPYNQCSIIENDGVLRGSISLKNIYIRSYDSSASGYKYGKIFGGIRISGGIKHDISNISINGFHIGLAMSWTWWNNLNTILIKAYSCCLFLGGGTTTNDFINFAADGLKGETSRLSEITDSENWMPTYCQPTNVGVVITSGSASFFGGSFEVLSMVGCAYSSNVFINEAYYEKITTSIFYANVSRIKMCGHKHELVDAALTSYGFFSKGYSEIYLKNVQYTTYWSDDQFGICSVDTTDWGGKGLYWDSFEFDSEQGIYINKQKHPNKVIIPPTVGYISAATAAESSNYPFISVSLRLGNCPMTGIKISEIEKRQDYNNISLYAVMLNSYNNQVNLSNKTLRFLTPNGFTPYMGEFNIYNCNLTFDHYVYRQKDTTHRYFKVSGNNTLIFNANVNVTDFPVIEIVGNKEVCLHIFVHSSSSKLFNASSYVNLDTNIKYKITVESSDKIIVFTNTTPPTIGVKVGDSMIYQDKPIWWTGSTWVDATGVVV